MSRPALSKTAAATVLRWIDEAKAESLATVRRHQPGLADWQANEQAAYLALCAVTGRLQFYAEGAKP